MKLEADNETLAENKVLILYLLSVVDKPITNDDLYRLVLSVQDINYFYFQQFLVDTLELTLDMLPGIIKLKVDTNIKGELKEIKDESAIKAEFIPISEKEFIVKCKILENNITTFEIQTLVSSREQATNIVKNWNENAGDIYLNVTKMLNEKSEEGE